MVGDCLARAMHTHSQEEVTAKSGRYGRLESQGLTGPKDVKVMVTKISHRP